MTNIFQFDLNALLRDEIRKSYNRLFVLLHLNNKIPIISVHVFLSLVFITLVIRVVVNFKTAQIIFLSLVFMIPNNNTSLVINAFLVLFQYFYA